MQCVRIIYKNEDKTLCVQNDESMKVYLSDVGGY